MVNRGLGEQDRPALYELLCPQIKHIVDPPHACSANMARCNNRERVNEFPEVNELSVPEIYLF